MKSFFVLIFIGFFGAFAFAGENPKNETDTAKINALNVLAKQHAATDIGKSKEYAAEALKFSEEAGYKYGIAESQFNLGNGYMLSDNMKQALEYLNKSLQYAVEAKDMYLMKDCYRALSLAYAGMKNYEKAFETHQLYADIKDEIFRQESIKITEETLRKYDVQKKDSDLKSLRNEITEQQTELDKQKHLKNYAIFSFVGMIIIIGSIAGYTYFKNKKK